MLILREPLSALNSTQRTVFAENSIEWLSLPFISSISRRYSFGFLTLFPVKPSRFVKIKNTAAPTAASMLIVKAILLFIFIFFFYAASYAKSRQHSKSNTESRSVKAAAYRRAEAYPEAHSLRSVNFFPVAL
ncbi:MAG: hypothetical protein Q3982_09950, partial [Phoenicibacter congonensis]|nr:hypothetical protein [Phoenicibacter congonensis]